MKPNLNFNWAWIVFAVILIWVFYLLIEVARHVHAWPFG